MNITKKDRDVISKKNAKLEEIKDVLKSEFIGIDQVIDQVIDHVRPYYIFPKSLKRPLVVNLFGMTGTGKTALVSRMVELLSLSHKFYRFDVGDYAKESSDWKLKSDLSSSVKRSDETDLVLVFDEFQFGRTIDEKGMEVDRSSLRPMWELIDSGVITVSAGGFSRVWDVYDKLRTCLKRGVRVVDGVVVDGVDVFYSTTISSERPYWVYPAEYSVVPAYHGRGTSEVEKNSDRSGTDWMLAGDRNTDKERTPIDRDDYRSQVEYDKGFDKPYFISVDSFNALFNANPEVFNNKKKYTEFRDTMFKAPPDVLLAEIYEQFIVSAPLMHKKDYSNSLIFVIGNIDEAYAMSHSADPDADADIFYEWAQKITVPRMKHALSARFRMEQIGRLGNNIVIYPALNSESYRKVIELHLQRRVEMFASEFGIKVTFDESVRSILYKESVYPTQGVRPVLSTFNSFIDSYVAMFISDLILEEPKAKVATWLFRDDESGKNPRHVMLVNGREFAYPVKLHIDQLRRSDMSENQMYTAVHEAGHAVLSMVAMKLVPKEVVSKTASIAEGYCRVERPTQMTKELMFETIVMTLGGREAEMAVFGERNLSDGAGSDLNTATQMAVSMVKLYGMGRHSYQVQASASTATGIFAGKWSDEAEAEAIEIFKSAQKRARRLVSEHIDKVLYISEYLSENAKIEHKELSDLARRWKLETRDKDDYHKFKTMFKKAKRKPRH